MNIRMVGNSNLFNSTINSSQVNKCSAQMRTKVSGIPKNTKSEDGDSVDISPLGKTISLIEDLTKRKQEIKEAKNELIKTTFKERKSLSDIQEKLDMYDEQIRAIDEQIMTAKADKMELERINNQTKEIEKKEDEKKKLEEESKKQELEKDVSELGAKDKAITSRLSNIVSASANIDQIKISQSVQRRADSKIKILRSESSRDPGIEKKNNIPEINHLKSLSANMSGRIGQQISSVNKEINEDNSMVDKEQKNKVGLKFNEKNNKNILEEEK